MPAEGDAPASHVEALLFIGLLIVVAKLAEGVLSWAGLSSIIAYTGVGILLGPVTGLIDVTDANHLKIFLDIGVFIFSSS